MPDAKDDLKKKVTLEDIERLECEEREADAKHGRLLDGDSPQGTRRVHEVGDSPKKDPLRRHERDGDSPKKDPLHRHEDGDSPKKDPLHRHEDGDSPKKDPLRRYENGDSPKKDPLRRKEPDDPIGGRLLDGDPKRPRHDD